MFCDTFVTDICPAEDKWNMRVAVAFASKNLPPGIHAMINCLRCPVGTHIEWFYRNLKNAINSFYATTKKLEKLTISDVKSIFFVILILEIPNPSYASATKEELTLNNKEYGIVWKPYNSFMRKLDKNGLRNFMEEKERQKELGALKSLASLKNSNNVKARGKMVMSEKYDPATGRGKGDKTLILTEGDSAKTLAVAGLSVVGRERYGIFPLRGKLLNPNGKTAKQISENVEIKTIIQILGLRPGTASQKVHDLNYQKILLFSDQDCFSHDTPVLVKKDGEIDCMTIKKLDDAVNDGDYFIWSDSGWTRIVNIVQKKTTKKMVHINAYCGFLKCTEDHRCLLENGDEIKACDLKIGDKMMRTRRIPKIDTNCTHKNYNYGKMFTKSEKFSGIEKENEFCAFVGETECTLINNLDVDEAYAWGLFFADGTCGVYSFRKNYENYKEKCANNSRKSGYNPNPNWLKWVDKYETRIEKLTSKNELTKKERNALNYTRKKT